MAVCLPLPPSSSSLCTSSFSSVSSCLLPSYYCPSSSSLRFSLSDKLDEILAAAQQTISTNDAAATRGPAGPKRDRGRSFYGNEVRLSIRLSVHLCPPTLCRKMLPVKFKGFKSFVSSSFFPPLCCPLQSFGDAAGLAMVPGGLSLGYNRGQFTAAAAAHGPPHGMLRQKSIGEAVCYLCLSVRPSVRPPVCLSSEPAGGNNALFLLSSTSSVSSSGHFISDCVAIQSLQL